MWPGLPQLKQRLLQGSFFTGLVQSRYIGWGAGGTAVVEGLEKEEEEGVVVVVEVMTGGEWNKDGLVVAAFSLVSWNCLHWLLSREVLCFHSAQGLAWAQASRCSLRGRDGSLVQNDQQGLCCQVWRWVHGFRTLGSVPLLSCHPDVGWRASSSVDARICVSVNPI